MQAAAGIVIACHTCLQALCILVCDHISSALPGTRRVQQEKVGWLHRACHKQASAVQLSFADIWRTHRSNSPVCGCTPCRSLVTEIESGSHERSGVNIAHKWACQHHSAVGMQPMAKDKSGQKQGAALDDGSCGPGARPQDAVSVQQRHLRKFSARQRMLFGRDSLNLRSML